MTQHRGALRASDDDGLGLIEVVVAMFLLAILAISVLPLFIQGLTTAARNTTLATATQLVNDRMQAAQAQSPSCSGVAGIAGTQQFTDPRGVVIRVTTAVGTCPSGAGTVSVVATAMRTDTSAVLTTSQTLVYVQ